MADALKVKIGGALSKHRLYQLAQAHSGWRHVTVIEGGESFLALSTGLQAALWALGGSQKSTAPIAYLWPLTIWRSKRS